MRIAMDLDNTVFNVSEKYRAVIEQYDGKYTPPVSYDVYKNGYSNAAAVALYELLNSDQIYQTHVFDNDIPGTLNALYQDSNHELFYITERLVTQHLPTLAQLERARIICNDSHLIHRIPKIDALAEYKIDLCFDDAPHVVSDCLNRGIDVVMISNEHTAYNHHLCGKVEHYPNLMMALKKRNLVK